MLTIALLGRTFFLGSDPPPPTFILDCAYRGKILSGQQIKLQDRLGALEFCSRHSDRSRFLRCCFFGSVYSPSLFQDRKMMGTFFYKEAQFTASSVSSPSFFPPPFISDGFWRSGGRQKRRGAAIFKVNRGRDFCFGREMDGGEGRGDKWRWRRLHFSHI